MAARRPPSALQLRRDHAPPRRTPGGKKGKRMMAFQRHSTFAMFVLLLGSAPVAAQTYTTIDVPGASVTAVAGINAGGAVTGISFPGGCESRQAAHAGKRHGHGPEAVIDLTLRQVSWISDIWLNASVNRIAHSPHSPEPGPADFATQSFRCQAGVSRSPDACFLRPRTSAAGRRGPGPAA